MSWLLAGAAGAGSPGGCVATVTGGGLFWHWICSWIGAFQLQIKDFFAEGQQPPAVGGRVRTILETDCAGDVRLAARVEAMCCSRSLHACSMRGG